MVLATDATRVLERAQAFNQQHTRLMRKEAVQHPSGNSERIARGETEILDELFSLAVALEHASFSQCSDFVSVILGMQRQIRERNLRMSRSLRPGWARCVDLARRANTSFASTAPRIVATRIFGFAITTVIEGLAVSKILVSGEDQEWTQDETPSVRKSRDTHRESTSAGDKPEVDPTETLVHVLKQFPAPLLGFCAPALTDKDMRLALTWIDVSARTWLGATMPSGLTALVAIGDAEQEKDEDYWEVERCLSARRAELFVLSLRLRMGQFATDLSQLQNQNSH